MHELSIISNIVEIATEEVIRAGGEKVEVIELEVGDLTGVELSALKFVWDSGVQESVLAEAQYLIHCIPGKGRCSECDTLFEIKEWFDPCPLCGSYQREIVAGKELIVKSLTIS